MIDNRVDIVLSIDKVVSFLTKKQNSLPILVPPPFSKVPTLHWMGCDFKNIHPQSVSCSYACSHAFKRGWLAMVWVCVLVCVTDPQGEKQSWQQCINFHPNFKMEWRRPGPESVFLLTAVSTPLADTLPVKSHSSFTFFLFLPLSSSPALETQRGEIKSYTIFHCDSI